MNLWHEFILVLQNNTAPRSLVAAYVWHCAVAVSLDADLMHYGNVLLNNTGGIGNSTMI
jgi:hypothetical protein